MRARLRVHYASAHEYHVTSVGESIVGESTVGDSNVCESIVRESLHVGAGRIGRHERGSQPSGPENPHSCVHLIPPVDGTVPVPEKSTMLAQAIRWRRCVHTIEFFFDCSSPWTYLAFESIQPIAARSDVAFHYRPILVGGVFNAVNQSVYENRANPVPAKARYYKKDLADWARHAGIEIGSPPVFPVNSVKAMRGALVALEADCLVPYARAVFQAYWGQLQDISRDEVLADIATYVGLAPDDFFGEITKQARKDALRSNTDELIERGGFGSPTMFLDSTDMYFGNDRLPLLLDALDR